MYPKLIQSGSTVAILNNIINSNISRRVNNKFTFSFECYEQDLKTEYLQIGNKVEVDGDLFNIQYIEQSHDSSGEITFKCECEHVFYELIDTEINNYAFTGTPTQILNDLVAGTDFTIGTVDYTDSIVFAVNQTTTKMKIIITLANTLGGELDFDNYEISLKNEIGQDRGYVVMPKKNLKSIDKIIDNRGDLKIAYGIDFIDLSQTENIKKLGLENLETVEIGDTITIKDSQMNIDEKLEVLELSKDPIKAKNLNVKLTNNIDLFQDEVYYNKLDSVKKSEVIYGVKINNEVGIEIERDDQLARTILNADEFRMQTGDGAGSYTDALYFDPIEEKFFFAGELQAASGTFTGELQAASGTFTGELQAASGTFTGDLRSNRIIISDGSNTASLNMQMPEGYLMIRGSDGPTTNTLGIGQVAVPDGILDDLDEVQLSTKELILSNDLSMLGNMLIQNGNLDMNNNNIIDVDNLDVRTLTANGTSTIEFNDIAEFNFDVIMNQDLSVDNITADILEVDDGNGVSKTPVTTPYFASNYCYVDTDGTNVTFRDSAGNVVLTI